MKKVILGLLTFATIATVTGCGGKATNTMSNGGNTEAESTINVSWKTYDGHSATKEEWESNTFLTELPYPELNNINLDYESSTWTDIFVYQVSLSQYKKYANMCKSAGFTTDMIFDDSMFMAKKGDTSLLLAYNSDTGVLEISYHYPEK